MSLSFKIIKKNKELFGSIRLPYSKSISNRILIMRFLSGEKSDIKNISTANDTILLSNILSSLNSGSKNKTPKEIDAKNAGTTFRFLTAALCLRSGEYLLTGDKRMKKRPIGTLVEALKKLGAKIEYAGEKNYPPLLISESKLTGGKIEIDSPDSSQYISALLMIAPLLEGGLKIKLKNKTPSMPYIKMTLDLMRAFGIDHHIRDNTIIIDKQKYCAKDMSIEADWSAASYWYSAAALSDKVDLKILGLKRNSLQGDCIIHELFENFGLKTKFISDGIHLTKSEETHFKCEFDFSDYPDIAQTIAVTCAGLNYEGVFSGIESLKIKETDRIIALKNELKKLNYIFEKQSENKWKLINKSKIKKISKIKYFNTYNDHRMAMAFAPLAICEKEIIIKNPEVVVKSYPGFWNDLKSLGFEIYLV